jgi:mannose/cellobiose epimerase-like protein (N-acyl-D-glucosamine 2-epimerase family)
MHLLEGCLAAHATTGASVFRDYALRVLTLFDTVLFDAGTSTIAEHFADDWSRAPGTLGRIIEPGHHYEWVWLLNDAARIGVDTRQRALMLLEFADRFGRDPDTGLVYDQVLDDGSLHRASHRLWPNTESIKAHLAMFEQTGSLKAEPLVCMIRNLFDRYLGRPTSATWIDQLDERCNPAVDKIPTSSLYHVHLALAELSRLAPQLWPDDRRFDSSAEMSRC